MRDECLRIQITRGKSVESEHLVDVAVVNSGGDVLKSWGDVEKAIYPRSSVKSIQAIPFVESGAIEKYNLSNKHIALACASHNGEGVHTTAVKEWLSIMTLSESDLRCGCHAPLDEKTESELLLQNIPFSQLHNNCSGKHSGILSSVLMMNEEVRNYLNKDHPVQRKIKSTIEQMSSCSIPENDWGVDGCGVPTYYTPLKALSLAMARIGTPASLNSERALSCRKINSAVVTGPYYVGGRNRFCTNTMIAAESKLLVKGGAEGVYVASYLNGDIGIALKVRDGGKRAAEIALAYVLSQYKNEQSFALYLQNFLQTPLKNWVSTEIGGIRVI